MLKRFLCGLCFISFCICSAKAQPPSPSSSETEMSGNPTEPETLSTDSNNCFTAADNGKLNPALKVIRVGPVPRTGGDESYPLYPLTDIATENAGTRKGGLNDPNNDPHIDQYFYQNANRCNQSYGSSTNYDSCNIDPNDKEALLNLFPAPRHVCDKNQDPNVPGPLENNCQNKLAPHNEVRIWYKTYHQADSCTLAQIASTLGYDDAEIQKKFNDTLPADAKLDFVRDHPDDPTRTFLVDKIVNSGTAAHRFENLCVLLPQPGSNDPKLAEHIKGIYLDYEVWDGRSPELAQKFAQQVSELVHEKNKDMKILLYTTPLDVARTVRSGVIEVLPDHSKRLPYAFWKNFNYFPLHNFGYGPGYGKKATSPKIRNRQIRSRSNSNPVGLKRSLYNQLAMIEPDPSGNSNGYDHIMLAYNWADMSLEESKVMHDFIQDNHIPATVILSNHLSGVIAKAHQGPYAGLVPGGSCSKPLNRSLQCYLFGESYCSSSNS